MKKSFVLYTDMLDILDELTDEQAGKIFKAVKDFENGKEVKLEGILKAVFIPIQNQLVRDKEKYDSICEKNKENIKKRWGKQNDTTVYDRIRPDTKRYQAIPNDTKAYQSIPNDTYTDK